MYGVVLLACGLSAGSPAFAAPGDNDVGINIHSAPRSYINAAADLGVTWVRMDANWFQLEPSNDNYRWSDLDAAITAANTARLKVFITLAYTPSWVPRHGDTDGSAHNDVPNSSAEWTDFVTDAVTHFRALGVRHFGMWNEANLRQFFEGSVTEYVNTIARPGAAAVRSACNDCFVLGPDLAHVGNVDDYLADVLAATRGTWDIITHHSYNGFAETGWRIWDGDGFLNAVERRRFPFTRAALRELLDDVGYTGEVWITETGYRATPGDAAKEDRQAVYVRRVLEEQLQRAWFTNTFVYEVHDCGPDLPGCTIDGFGLMRATAGNAGRRTFPTDFRLKPAFTALKNFITAHPAIVNGSPPTECGDGVDNDGDGRIDLEDRGCTGPGDNDESDDPPRKRIDAPLTAGVTIDGDLSEFGPLDGPMLTDRDWRGTEPLVAGDLGVRSAVRWDPTGLYLGFVITDDRHQNDQSPLDLWQGDSIQLAFDVGQSGGREYDNIDDHELNFGLSMGQPRSFRFQGPARANDAIEVAIVRSGSTTTYEIKIAAAALPAATWAAGEVLGFSFLVNDADGQGRVGWMEWTPGIGQGKQPDFFGEIALRSAAPLPPDAGLPSGVADAGPEDARAPQDAGRAADAAAASSDTGAVRDAGARTPDARPTRSDARTTPSAPETSGRFGCEATSGRTNTGSAATTVYLIMFALWTSRRFRPR